MSCSNAITTSGANRISSSKKASPQRAVKVFSIEFTFQRAASSSCGVRRMGSSERSQERTQIQNRHDHPLELRFGDRVRSRYGVRGADLVGSENAYLPSFVDRDRQQAAIDLTDQSSGSEQLGGQRT